MRTMIFILPLVTCLAEIAYANPDLDQHRAILDSIVNRARSLELPNEIEIVVEQQTPPLSFTSDELANLQRIAPVDGNARLQLDRYEQEARSGGVLVTMRLMYEDAERWRLNTDRTPDKFVPYDDTATNGKEKWLLTPRNLRYARHSQTIDRFAVESGPLLVRQWLRTMATGVAWPVDSQYELVSTSPGKNGSTLYFVRVDDVMTLRLTVVGEGGPQDAHVIQIDRPSSEAKADFVPIAILSDWRPEPQFGLTLAHRYEMIARSGTREATIQLRSIERLNRPMDQLTALPTSDGVDPFRGPATFTSVVDLGRGQTHSVDVTDRSVGETIGFRRQGNPWLRITGFALAGCLAVMITLIVRSRRSL